MKPPSHEEVVRTNLRVFSATKRQDASMSEYNAALMTGSHEHVRATYNNAVEAFSALLDAMKEQAEINLKQMGIDPDERQ